MVVDDKDYCYLYHLPPSLLVVAVVRVIVVVAVVAAVRGVVVIV